MDRPNGSCPLDHRRRGPGVAAFVALALVLGSGARVGSSPPVADAQLSGKRVAFAVSGNHSLHLGPVTAFNVTGCSVTANGPVRVTMRSAVDHAPAWSATVTNGHLSQQFDRPPFVDDCLVTCLDNLCDVTVSVMGYTK
jgi:hypothetical protein